MNNLVNKIISFFPEEKEIVIFETNAHLGKNTLFFLDSERIKKIFSYEQNDEKRNILIKEIENKNIKKERYEIGKEYQGITENLSNVVLFIEYDDSPSWSPKKWILKDMYKISLVILKVPENYEFDISGFIYRVFDINNEKIYFLVHSKTIPHLEREHLDFKDSIFYKDSKTWETHLKNFIKNEILPIALDNEQVISKLTNSKSMEVWKNVFTSSKWNPNNGENYELYEYYGDSVMRTHFDNYIIKKFPKISQEEATNLRIHYLSKIEQGKISGNLKLDEYVRTPIRKDTSLREDLLEALFGGLHMLGDSTFKLGMGNALTYNFFISIFDKIGGIDLKFSFGDYKSKVKEIYDKTAWQKDLSSLEEYSKIDNEKQIFKLKYPGQAIRELKEIGLIIKDKNIVIIERVGGHHTQKSLSKEAYEKAYYIFKEKGITTEWANKVSRYRERDRSNFQESYERALIKAKEEGYKDFYIQHPKTFSESAYIQIIGIKSDDNKLDVLLTYKRKDSSDIDNTENALEYYATFGMDKYPM
uniref:Ribonuclease III n=1 Tax=Pithovirus LCPAC104 TaxID=2506589 RepID=A0A481Z6A4_9VIRU|nr:MAG: ribonuclease III [Pithovirus LCPAC104]